MPHTPGPWKLSPCRGAIETVERRHRSDGRFSLLPSRYVAASVAPEDARLIAAAPDLLDALQLCSDFLEANYDTRDMPDILVPVRLALAKVKTNGGTNE